MLKSKFLAELLPDLADIAIFRGVFYEIILFIDFAFLDVAGGGFSYFAFELSFAKMDFFAASILAKNLAVINLLSPLFATFEMVFAFYKF